MDLFYDSPVGGLQIGVENDYVRDINFLYKPLISDNKQNNHLQVEIKINKALQGYFRTAHAKLNLPLLIKGTDFQRRVWQALKNIPVGQTRTYGQLAKQLNSSAQAVGNACRQNPLPIIVPCHRVVSKKGIGGFCGQTAGDAMEVKYWLLRHEGVEPNEL